LTLDIEAACTPRRQQHCPHPNDAKIEELNQRLQNKTMKRNRVTVTSPLKFGKKI
jgi:hypothetical protein